MEYEYLPRREGLGKYVKRYDDGERVRARSGAKKNLLHNSTRLDLIRKGYAKSKSKLQDEILVYNFASII